MSSPAAAALVDDVVENVLLRIPPDSPEDLARAAVVCRPWYRVASRPDFRRRFREFHFHRAAAPPMLGVLFNIPGAGADEASASVRFVPTPSFRPSLPGGGRGWRALDSRHGRVLLGRGDPFIDGLVVWDPTTGGQQVLPELPKGVGTFRCTSWNAAVLCAGAASGAVQCDHLDCSSKPFLVAVVGANPLDEFAHLYSSDTGIWSEPSYLCQGLHLDYMLRGQLVGTVLYFKGESTTRVLKYDLRTRELGVISLPLGHGSLRHIVFMATDGGSGLGFAFMATDGGSGLGFAVVRGSRIHIWSREAESDVFGGWTQSKVIELKKLLPAILSISPYLVGIAKGVGVFFVQTVDGLFSIDLRSHQARKIHGGNVIGHVVPYESFWTPALGAVSTY